MAMAYGDPTGVNKILVEKYGYEWVNGKAWRPGTAPEPASLVVLNRLISFEFFKSNSSTQDLIM